MDEPIAACISRSARFRTSRNKRDRLTRFSRAEGAVHSPGGREATSLDYCNPVAPCGRAIFCAAQGGDTRANHAALVFQRLLTLIASWPDGSGSGVA